MAIDTEYLGMPLGINDLDIENLEFFRHCAEHNFHLQACEECDLVRYPPTTACPWCSCLESRWTPIPGEGAVHSYGWVQHAIQPAFREHPPSLILLSDLHVHFARPTAHEALHFAGNLTTPDGRLAPPEAVRRVGIGSRVRMVFTDVGEGLSLPQWTLDEDAEQPEAPWRYPRE